VCPDKFRWVTVRHGGLGWARYGRYGLVRCGSVRYGGHGEVGRGLLRRGGHGRVR
jgi:hypothetical protein